jgi:hypothetical protein
MNDIRTDWFWNQHYTTDELELLWNWIQKGGNNVKVFFHNGKWCGFHVLDTEKEVDLIGQNSKEDCIKWMIKIGFNVIL